MVIRHNPLKGTAGISAASEAGETLLKGDRDKHLTYDNPTIEASGFGLAALFEKPAQIGTLQPLTT